MVAVLAVCCGSAGAVEGGEGLFVGAGEGVEVALGGLDLGVSEAFHAWRHAPSVQARHKANHLNVVYAPDAETADLALRAKAAMFAELGVQVHLCGDVLSSTREM